MSSSTNSNTAGKLKVPSLFAGKAWQQVLTRDAKADGQFVYGVKTTKVFCRPSCPSRRPERKNVTFFPNPEQAAAAGYSACPVCEPEAVERRADPQIAAIDAVTSYLTEHASERTRLKDVSKATGVAPLTILRGFKRVLGVSPREYAKSQRAAKGKDRRRKTSDDVAVAARLTPSLMKKGGKGEVIRYSLADCELGRLLVAATMRGVCAVFLADTDAALEQELAKVYPLAERRQNDGEMAEYVARVIASIRDEGQASGVPVDVWMTPFQQRVWDALRAIPRGQLKTYGQLAAELGSPLGAMAVGGALGANPLALLVPCHRVVGSTGAMTGWRWGVPRKQQLLALEKEA